MFPVSNAQILQANFTIGRPRWDRGVRAVVLFRMDFVDVLITPENADHVDFDHVLEAVKLFSVITSLRPRVVSPFP